MSEFSQDRCRVCGAPLSIYKRYYCSQKCRERARRKIWKKPEKVYGNQGLSWDEVIQGMKETGLQYGDYVARYDYGSTE